MAADLDEPEPPSSAAPSFGDSAALLHAARTKLCAAPSAGSLLALSPPDARMLAYAVQLAAPSGGSASSGGDAAARAGAWAVVVADAATGLPLSRTFCAAVRGLCSTKCGVVVFGKL